MSDRQMGYSGSWGRTHLAGSGGNQEGLPGRGAPPEALTQCCSNFKVPVIPGTGKKKQICTDIQPIYEINKQQDSLFFYCSTRNYIQYLVTNYNRKQPEAVLLKLTQYGK